MSRGRMCLGVLCVVVCVAGAASAEIPQVISYQGKVTDTGGTPVADGNYTMRFRIYDAATVGTLLWDSGNRSISVAGGIFSVLLGESPQPALTLDFSQDYWLLVTFAGVDQTPRQRMASTGYAYMASGLVPGTEVIGSVTSGTSAAISGTNTATTVSCGGRFESYSPAGRGVYGYASATSGLTLGLYGLSASISGCGVYGQATATSGFTYGVYGQCNSTSGTAVYGETSAMSGTTYGVYGQCRSTSGRGVYGYADASSGTTYGVYGQCNSTDGCGVYGRDAALSGQTEGVFGVVLSSQGRGVVGWAQATTGATRGVYGRSDSTDGHGVYFSGGLAGTGTKSCVVKTSQGPTLMYCQESPENWFEDFGEGQLVNGRCRIELDPLFLETVTIDAANPMHVFVQPYDESCRDLVVKRSGGGFDVVNPAQPDAGGVFSYRVVAKRKGFEAKRLDYCAAAERDSYLYPELREKELQELESERARHDEERARMDEEHRRLEGERERIRREDVRAAIGHAAMNE